jgi:hypothetical protein
MLDPKFLGVAPAGLVEKSKRVVQEVVVFLSQGYITYQMYEGVSHYSGFVPYEKVTLQ